MDGVELHVPSGPELPRLFDKVYPVNEIVRVDYLVPGCPPSGDAIWKYLNDLILGRMPRPDHHLLHYVSDWSAFRRRRKSPSTLSGIPLPTPQASMSLPSSV